MRKIILAVAGLGLALSAAPSFAQGYGHSSGYGHNSGYGHTPRHSYQPVYVEVKPVKTYETKEAYVWQKVKGYCKEEVVKYGYREFRKTIECKAGEPHDKDKKVVEKVEPIETTPPAEPAPAAPAPAEAPQK